jgi:glycine betaine/proline transport system substrate-binding protein
MSCKRLVAILGLVLGTLALTGCGGLGQGKGLLLANIGWDENVAVSNLTKVLLEDELGYERVDIDTSDDLDATYRRVASGELESVINEENDPLVGARRWASENREVVQPWVKAARNAR